jgi:hypothetical protein
MTMRTGTRILASLLPLIAGMGLSCAAYADDGHGEIPRYVVDPWWPKPLPHRWVTGAVGGARAAPAVHACTALVRGAAAHHLVLPAGCGAAHPVDAALSDPAGADLLGQRVDIGGQRRLGALDLAADLVGVVRARARSGIG